VALHDRGLVDVVTTPFGLLARRQGESALYHLPYPRLAILGPLEGWDEVGGDTLLDLARSLSERGGTA
jgi:hypothetical protein